MKLAVDQERCQGHGRCHATAPELFGLDDLGYSVLLAEAGEVPNTLAEAAARAVAGCPERAITIEEEAR